MKDMGTQMIPCEVLFCIYCCNVTQELWAGAPPSHHSLSEHLRVLQFVDYITLCCMVCRVTLMHRSESLSKRMTSTADPTVDKLSVNSHVTNTDTVQC